MDQGHTLTGQRHRQERRTDSEGTFHGGAPERQLEARAGFQRGGDGKGPQWESQRKARCGDGVTLAEKAWRGVARSLRRTCVRKAWWGRGR